MRPFAEVRAVLDRLGWSYSLATEWRGTPGVDRRQHDLDLFAGFRLPLTAQDWVSLLLNHDAPLPEALRIEGSEEISDDGEPWYRGSEDMSWQGGPCEAAQRKIRACLTADGGSVSGASLREIGDLMRDGWDAGPGPGPFTEPTEAEMAEAIEHCVEHPDQMSAWGKIALLYYLVKDHVSLLPDEASPRHRDEFEDACLALHTLAWSLGMHSFFGTFNRVGATPTQRDASYVMRFARFAPAFHVVARELRKACPGPVEGWGIYDREEGDVATNDFGVCLYATRLEAEKIIALWQRHRDQLEDRVPPKLEVAPAERFEVRPVRVSLDDGLEFTDGGAPPRPRVERRTRPGWLPEKMRGVEDLDLIFDEYAKTRVLLHRALESGDKWDTPAYTEALLAWREAASFVSPGEGED